MDSQGNLTQVLSRRPPESFAGRTVLEALKRVDRIPIYTGSKKACIYFPPTISSKPSTAHPIPSKESSKASVPVTTS